jgi:hypothetical protein
MNFIAGISKSDMERFFSKEFDVMVLSEFFTLGTYIWDYVLRCSRISLDNRDENRLCRGDMLSLCYVVLSLEESGLYVPERLLHMLYLIYEIENRKTFREEVLSIWDQCDEIYLVGLRNHPCGISWRFGKKHFYTDECCRVNLKSLIVPFFNTLHKRGLYEFK